MIEARLHGIGAYRGGERIGPIVWPHYDLIVVTRGKAVYTVAEREWVCGAGSAFIVPPGHRFSGRTGADGCVIWVQHFDVSREVALGSGLRLPSEPELWAGSAARDWPETLMRQAHDLQQDTAAPSRALSHVLWLLLHTLVENQQSAAEVVRNATRENMRVLHHWLESHPHPLPSVEQLAARAGYSNSHFRQCFRRYVGRSAGTYLRRLRLQEAARLLCESNLPIKVISTRIGYSDPVAFHRAFTQSQGITPARFRSQTPKIA